jgi:hypothetical protein
VAHKSYLRPLDPTVLEPLGNGWDLLASEGGRSPEGLRMSATLYNGTPKLTRKLAVGDDAEQQKVATDFAPHVGLGIKEIVEALARLAASVDGILRQMEAQDDQQSAPSQATRLVALALDAGAELFHSPEGEAFASIDVDGHQETWLLKVKGFRRWLSRLFYADADKAPGAQAIQDALGVLEGKALFDGPEYPVYTRLAEVSGVIYLDLGNPTWQAIEITAGAWQVIDTPPVKFRRARGMLPLPTPVQPTPRHTSTLKALKTLRSFINIAREEDWKLLLAWVLAALRPHGPYPILVIYGEQGSAKTTLMRILRDFIDPNTAPLRTMPRNEEDLVIAANNGWLIALDNLSHLPDWLSDALCRLATSSGYATRELYTNTDEILFAAQRPIMINGIEEVATRGDFLDRAIILYLPTVPEDKRKEEDVLREELAKASPHIFGALLSIVSAAVKALPTTTLTRKPRMADFARWSCASAQACGWTDQEFLAAYQGARDAMHELTLEASAVGPLLRDFVQHHYNQQRNTPLQKPWEGTASDLLLALEHFAQAGASAPPPPTGQGVTMQAPTVHSNAIKQKVWPKNARALGNALRRLAPNLRAVGVGVTLDLKIGKARTRMIQLSLLSTGSPPNQTAGAPGQGQVSGTI